MYYRCYDPDGMSMRCGTVQIRGPSGQIWIEENMREKTQIGGMEHAARRVVQDPPREDIPTEDIRREVESVKAKRRRSLLDLLPMGAGDE
ncbi:MAG TPA: hypothetical protein VFL97_05125 [Nitrococcus sp.]|nr:hypothetical protein [Nitrococcus sp.]